MLNLAVCVSDSVLSLLCSHLNKPHHESCPPLSCTSS